MIDPGGLLRRAGIKLMEKARKTDALGLLPELMDSQWLSYGELRSRQIKDLRNHLVYCRDHFPFYSRMFEKSGFHPEHLVSVQDLSRLPLMDKSIIKEAGGGLLAADRSTRGIRLKRTSGSTGIPLNFYLDHYSHSIMWGNIWRAWSVIGYQPGDLYAILSGGSLLPEKVDLKQKLYLLLSVCVHLPSYHLTDAVMEQYAVRLAKKRVAFLYGYPSSLELFSSFLIRRGLKPGSINAVFTTSELLSPEAREIIEEGIGCPVFDIYGCNDGGLFSFECEQHAGLHQAMECCVVEIVDEGGSPVKDGEIGRIVTTHLANKTHPFVRYITGDIGAIVNETCACGRGLARIVNIQGRERDFILTPAGRKVHGAFFNHFEPFYRAEWLERFQVHQPDRDHLEVRVIVNRPPSDAETADMTAELIRGLGEIKISIKIVEEFELTPTGKFRVVTSALKGMPPVA